MNSDFAGPLNLGNPEEFTILELAKNIIEKVNPSLDIVFKSLPEDDPKRRKPNIELAKNKLNWEPTVNLSEGLDKTISYFKEMN